ncbi:MAG: hypothetical protein ACRDZ4_10495 [Egibacteraceae bacterium]
MEAKATAAAGTPRGGRGQTVRAKMALNQLPLTDALMSDGDALLRQYHQQPRNWIARHVELLTFTDHLTAARTTTLDVDVLADRVKDFPVWRGRTLFPVKLMSRDMNVNIIASDGNGKLLPQLPRKHERSLVAAGIVHRYLTAPTSLSYFSGKFNLYQDVLAEIDPGLHPASGRILPRDENFIELVSRYKARRLVIVAVDADRSNGGNDLLARLVICHPEPCVPTRSRFTKLVDDNHVTFPVEQLEDSERIHVEVIAPSGTYVHKGLMTITTTRRAEDLTKERSYTREQTDPHPDRAHFYCTVNSGWISRRTFIKEANVDLIIRPLTMGMMGAGFLSCWLSLLSLAVFLFTLGCPEILLVPELKEDVQSVVTVLLLGPTLLSGAIIRQGEHLMTKRMVLPLRCRLGAAGLATLIASAAFALGVVGEILCTLLKILTIISATITLGTSISYTKSWFGLRKQRVVQTV